MGDFTSGCSNGCSSCTSLGSNTKCTSCNEGYTLSNIDNEGNGMCMNDESYTFSRCLEKGCIPRGYVGGFSEKIVMDRQWNSLTDEAKRILTNGGFKKLSDLPLLDNRHNHEHITRQMRVLWPEFSWVDPATNKRVYRRLPGDVSRMGYDDTGQIHNVICPQFGKPTPLGTIYAEFTVTGVKGFVNEELLPINTEESSNVDFLNFHIQVEVKIWFHWDEILNRDPETEEEEFVHRFREIASSLGWQLPMTKQTAVKFQILNHCPERIRNDEINPNTGPTPDDMVLQIRPGMNPNYEAPEFTKHPEACAVAYLEGRGSGVKPTGNPRWDMLNEFIVSLSNVFFNNMFNKGNVLTWNLWFGCPELVNTHEWIEHVNRWSQSILTPLHTHEFNVGDEVCFENDGIHPHWVECPARHGDGSLVTTSDIMEEDEVVIFPTGETLDDTRLIDQSISSSVNFRTVMGVIEDGLKLLSEVILPDSMFQPLYEDWLEEKGVWYSPMLVPPLECGGSDDQPNLGPPCGLAHASPRAAIESGLRVSSRCFPHRQISTINCAPGCRTCSTKNDPSTCHSCLDNTSGDNTQNVSTIMCNIGESDTKNMQIQANNPNWIMECNPNTHIRNFNGYCVPRIERPLGNNSNSSFSWDRDVYDEHLRGTLVGNAGNAIGQGASNARDMWDDQVYNRYLRGTPVGNAGNAIGGFLSGLR